jgi:DNA-binding SARP family transcriptional activator/Tfp pilus assembly protein PilF
MPTLTICLLGPPRIERDGAPVTVDTRKAIALLAYLAATRQQHTRDTLAGLLWPDYDQSHARATLRRTLSTLHKALGGEWLEAGRETIGLARGAGLWVDLDAFLDHLAACRSHGHTAAAVCPACVEPLAAAAALYHDDFLAGFAVRDSPSFEDWQFFQSQSLRRELASALDRLTQCHTALAEYDQAITYARRWLALDRLHEPAHRRLMRLYAWAGQRTAAVRQYRECAQVLDRELGVAPLEETIRLYEAIKDQRAPAPPLRWNAADATTPAGVTASTLTLPAMADAVADAAQPAALGAHILPAYADFPLVGRSAEWAALMKACADGATTGQFVVLEGEAGIGKTRLAEEFLADQQSHGAAALTARCYEGESGLAYGPVVASLRAAVTRPDAGRWLDALPPHWIAEAARLVPELAALRPDLPPAPALSSPGARSRFFEGLRQVLLAACGGARPGVLCYDDVHWADDASLDLFTYLVRRLHERPLCLLLTWRGEAVPPDHRLRRLLAEAQRAGTATLIPLSRLSAESVRELLRTVAARGAAPPEGAAERLYGETEGLPFFLIEYLEALAKGELAGADGGDGAWALPGGVRDLLRSRVAAVDETGWQLLTAAAVIGRSFDFETLRAASGRSEEEVVAGLEELIAHRLVTETAATADHGAPTYDFSHEKLRALVYDETSLARRRLLHRRVAEALAAHARSPREAGALAGQIAHHYLHGGNEAAAAEQFKRAGEHARALYANTEALAHLRMALALSHPATGALHEAIGDVRTLLGEYAAALASYETAAALSPPDALAAIEHKLGAVYMRRGEWAHAQSHLEAAAAATAEGSAGLRARIYADWSLTAQRRGQPDAARELAGQALALAETASDARALAQAHNMLGVLASSRGDLEGAQRHLERSLTLAEELQDPGARAAALNNLALAYGASGATARAVELAEAALALCVAQGDRHREAALHNNLADLLHAAGDATAAMSHLKRAVSIYADIGIEAGTVQPEIWKLTEW